MGWFFRLFGTEKKPVSPPPPVNVPAARPTAGGIIETENGQKPVALLPATGRGYFVEVHGEGSYQDALRDLLEGTDRRHEASVRLVAEPENQYDVNAVVVQTFRGRTLGYLTREDARRYQQLFLQLKEKDLIGIASAKLYGGTKSKPHIGIFLDLEPATVVASRLGLSYTRVKRGGVPS